ncbi:MULTISPECIES: hypothetical protein [unclassified Nocardioides]|uniref:hypothetical protein n=1 Tax=unclassified Nocardioides TaxID=2615069 RepID=UPI0009F0B83D|nr:MULTISPECIES: hypothetical protein [unclassified Nocardioides]GAW51131.1 RNA polymerase, sigma-24 subunit, ECF subfamily [Nocardioides sp. PD653-B2]GAW57530.1 RNA polymerase, sigma-24 subunit, ECF subfamily [Nocardioides sp. PD653]
MNAVALLEELGVSDLGEVDEPAFSGLAERHRRELHVRRRRGAVASARREPVRGCGMEVVLPGVALM